MACALALHVADEAITGFLPLYNRSVAAIRVRLPWLPLPRFTFQVWLAGLTVAVAVLLALTPLVSPRRRWMRVASAALGVLMVANAFGHAAASLYLGAFAPGVYSSPILLVAAAALLVTTFRVGPAKYP